MKNKKLVIIIAIIAFLLAAAIAAFALLTGIFNSKPSTTTTSVTTTTQVASSSSSVAPVASSSMAESSASTSESSAATGDEKSTTVTFSFFVHGEPIGTFDVPNAVGKTVFEAMESNKEIKFNFNQDEGVIDTFFDNKNDGINTWVYLLNHQVAEAGTKTQKLKAGDSIQWYFGTIDEIPTTIIPAESSSAQ